jgi:hypothetical protein
MTVLQANQPSANASHAPFPRPPFAPWEERAPLMMLPPQELAFDRKISYTNRTRVSAPFSSMVLGWESIKAIV